MQNDYQVVMVEVSKIKPDPKQPRKYFSKESIEELAASIKEHGVIKNIEIDKDFFIVTGENRWRAAKKAGLHKIPCRIIDQNDETRFERQLHENIHHAPMTEWDLAVAIRKYVDAGESNASIARRFGKSHSWVNDRMNLFKLSPRLQEELKKLSAPTKTVSAIKRVSDMEKSGLLEEEATDFFVAKIKANPDVSQAKVKICAERIRQHPTKYKDIIKLACSDITETEFVAEIDTKYPQTKAQPGFGGLVFANKLLKHIKQTTAYIKQMETHLGGYPPNELLKAIGNL